MSDPNLIDEIKEVKKDVAEINSKIDEILEILRSITIVEDTDDDEEDDDDYSNEGWVSEEIEWFDSDSDEDQS